MAGSELANLFEPATPRRHFAAKILFFHAILLAAVLGLVLEAALQIYSSTRQEEQLHARTRLELLAELTRRSIETYYQSVLQDLKWARISPGISSMGDVGQRVSAIFYYDRAAGKISAIFPRGGAPAEITNEMRRWLGQTSGDRVSPFLAMGGIEVSLVATTGRKADELIVAIVPAEQIQADWLPLLTDTEGIDATLFDDRLQVITSSSPLLRGVNLAQAGNADLADLANDYISHPRTMSRVFSRPLALRGGQMKPSLVTISPVTVAGGNWALLLADSLDSIDANVSQLLGTTITWGVFVAISVTAIVISTGIQLVRYRSRVERVRGSALRRELTQARRIQLNWLPENFQIDPSIDLAAVNHPASHISGDFYNWFTLEDGRHVVIIGDVSGHGMTAAFLMATTQLLVENTMMRLPSPGAAMEEVNRQLATQKYHGQFVTLLILVIDLERSQISLASAGHPAPLVSEDGSPFRPMAAETQLVLGLEKHVGYSTQVFPLNPMTRLLLYTDGVTDAANETGERYSVEQLIAALGGPFRGAQTIVDAAVGAINQFRGTRELEDDLTLVAIDFHHIAASAKSTPLAVVR